MSAITTHILDVSRGKPAAGVAIVLTIREGGIWRQLGQGTTDADGRLRSLLPEGEPLAAGTYQLWFDTAAYFGQSGAPCFFPEVSVSFTIAEPGGHYHVPLLLSPFGYSTYRGS
ncbi:MAG: hydroxyisourate hydrolase [Thermoanaerobaculia bacterium]